MARLLLPPAESLVEMTGNLEACSTPLRFVVDSGQRPIVLATIDGVETSMLVHANAGFVAMLTHDALFRVAGRRVSKDRDFGLGHDLHLSSSGRGTTEVETLTVAGSTMSEVRLEVFDLPTTNWEGMLGVEWLAACGAVVDFGRARLTVPGEVAEQAAGSVRDQVVELRRDQSTGRFTCRLSVGPDVDALGRFVVSTVAETSLDVEYARQQGIELGDPVEYEHGPTGAVVPVYRPQEPFTFCFGDRVLAVVHPSIYDIYAYGENPRPDAASCLAGYVGADVLLETRAVVDFGAGEHTERPL